jgi:hypothetical protein
MPTKVALILFIGMSIMSCDSDFKQGNCDEGFFEQANGMGGTHCVPITDTTDSAIIETDNYSQTD